MTKSGRRKERLFALFTAASVAWMGCLCHVSSQAGVDFLWFLGLLVGAKFLVALWVASYSHAMRGWGAKPARKQFALGALAAGISLSALASLPQRPLFRLRFALSRPALERAASLAPRVDSGQGRGIVGLFPLISTEVHEGQVRFLTTRCGLIDRCGFVFAGSSPPSRREEDRFEPLGGGWYHLYEGF